MGTSSHPVRTRTVIVRDPGERDRDHVRDQEDDPLCSAAHCATRLFDAAIPLRDNPSRTPVRGRPRRSPRSCSALTFRPPPAAPKRCRRSGIAQQAHDVLRQAPGHRPPRGHLRRRHVEPPDPRGSRHHRHARAPAAPGACTASRQPNRTGATATVLRAYSERMSSTKPVTTTPSPPAPAPMAAGSARQEQLNCGDLDRTRGRMSRTRNCAASAFGKYVMFP